VNNVNSLKGKSTTKKSLSEKEVEDIEETGGIEGDRTA
jgi:hypothetical protein